MALQKKLDQQSLLPGSHSPQLPPKVEYSLTEIGWSIMPIIDAMNQWGDANREFLENVIAQDARIPQTSKSVCQIYNGMVTDRSLK